MIIPPAEDGKDHDGSYQTQDAAENVKDGDDFEVDIHIRVHILISRIVAGWGEYITKSA